MKRLVPLLLVALPALGDERDDRIRELEAKVAALEKRIAWLERMRDFRDGTKPQRAVVRLGGEPDRDRLEGITLPDGATKEQVRWYVGRILAAASRRSAFGATDPEVDLLRKVGPAHVDVLIEPLVHVPFLNGDIYLVEALKSLARQEHRDLVLKALPQAWQLVQVVQAHGWTRDAAPTLIEVLADRRAWSHRTLPTEWIDAVAELNRPDSHEALKAYLYYGGNRYHTWKAIRRLPEMKLGRTVEQLWRWAKDLDDQWTRSCVAAAAAHYGHADALAVLFEDPDDWMHAEVIRTITPYPAEHEPPEHAKRWFRANRDRLEFDPSGGVYRLTSAKG